jgi:hypothetical protein
LKARRLSRDEIRGAIPSTGGRGHGTPRHLAGAHGGVRPPLAAGVGPESTNETYWNRGRPPMSKRRLRQRRGKIGSRRLLILADGVGILVFSLAGAEFGGFRYHDSTNMLRCALIGAMGGMFATELALTVVGICLCVWTRRACRPDGHPPSSASTSRRARTSSGGVGWSRRGSYLYGP